MLTMSNIFYSVEGRPLFDGASATIPNGHKVGLVGRNGAGKTTLFNIIKGDLFLDSGNISIPSRARIGSVAQEVPGNEISLLDSVLAADTEREELLTEAERAKDPNRIGEIQARLNDIDAWSAEARASSILKGLGFIDKEQTMPCSSFSGGWRMRVALAGVLFSQPDLLLLDEPTNYLDLEGALWLENFLFKYPHTVIIISHDRALLNRSVEAILHLEDKKLCYYSGPYDQFARQRLEQRAMQASLAKKQDARKVHLQSFVDRFRAKASKAKQAQARLKMIQRMEQITPPEEAGHRIFSFPEPEKLSPPIISIKDGQVGYDGFAVLKQLDLRIDQDDRIALLGRNGQGKSTLSKLLSGRLHCMSGTLTRSTKLRIGYFAQHQVDELNTDETPLQHLQKALSGVIPTKLRAQLAGFGLGADQADLAVERLSGGQKARLALLLATLHAPHLLVLDEPTNHLDIESREALVKALNLYSGAVILVTHDMHLLSLVADRLWLIKDGAVNPYEEDLETYRKELFGGYKRKDKQAKKKPNVQKARRDQILSLKSEVQKNEARLEKLNNMREKLVKKLANPELYEIERIHELETWNRKYAEVLEALERAEALWIAAAEKLEKANSTAWSVL